MFTVEEITLMKFKLGVLPNRENLIKSLKVSLVNADREVQEMMDEIIRKLTAMTDEQFKRIDFSLALDDSE